MPKTKMVEASELLKMSRVVIPTPSASYSIPLTAVALGCDLVRLYIRYGTEKEQTVVTLKRSQKVLVEC
jgi:hypothetical protein